MIVDLSLFRTLPFLSHLSWETSYKTAVGEVGRLQPEEVRVCGVSGFRVIGEDGAAHSGGASRRRFSWFFHYIQHWPSTRQHRNRCPSWCFAIWLTCPPNQDNQCCLSSRCRSWTLLLACGALKSERGGGLQRFTWRAAVSGGCVFSPALSAPAVRFPLGALSVCSRPQSELWRLDTETREHWWMDKCAFSDSHWNDSNTRDQKYTVVTPVSTVVVAMVMCEC